MGAGTHRDHRTTTSQPDNPAAYGRSAGTRVPSEEAEVMRVEASATSLSWIPSEAVTGPTKATFGMGVTRYDTPPPDVLHDLMTMRDADAFRFANRLEAWAEFNGDVLVGHHCAGGLVMGSTTVRVAKLGATFTAVGLPDLRPPVETGAGWVRFSQTCGGRTALPMPRPVRHPPFVKLQAPIVWTTLSLTLYSDGSHETELTGASSFPRHWVYDTRGELLLKAGLADYKHWMAHSFGRRTPWGDQDSAAIVTATETALERQISRQAMGMHKRPRTTTLKAGEVLARQGDQGDELFLLLDGVLTIDVDGTALGELGPGAMLGERALLEGSRRTATMTARTTVRVARFPAATIDLARLSTLAEQHDREAS